MENVQQSLRGWPPRLVVAAPQGHSGKTIVSLGICAVMRERGLVVQPFKKGPDYIDPSWLTAAAGRPCRNLDSVLMPAEKVIGSFSKGCCGADLAVIEGAMGLYDGLEPGRSSTADIAGLLRSPVILVINAARMTQSIAAMVAGYQNFQPGIAIRGVVLNNVSGTRHERKLREAIEQYCDIPVLGSLPRESGLNIPERHLGLYPFGEIKGVSLVNSLGRRVAGCLNLESILAIARSAEARSFPEVSDMPNRSRTVRIGVVRDEAFSFYYPENLEALNEVGAELVYIDSLTDRELPDIDSLYIGGGFPEVFLDELEANFRLRREIARAIESNMPVYAECAGLMYLSRAIAWHGKRHEMVGAIPAEVEMCDRPQGHGYVQAQTTGNDPFFPAGMVIWGHEFHHSKISISGDIKFAYELRRGNGIARHCDGIVYRNVLAAYTHLHALGVPVWAEAFVGLTEQSRGRRSYAALK